MKRNNSPSDAVIILAAGAGTRMGDLTSLVPKHLLPYHGKAILSHILEQYPKRSNFILMVHPQDELTQDYVEAAHPDLKVKVVISNNKHRGYPMHDFNQALDHVWPSKAVFLTVADGVYTLPTFTDEKFWVGAQHRCVSEQMDYTNFSVGSMVVPPRIHMVLEKTSAPRMLSWSGVAYFGVLTQVQTQVREALMTSPKSTFGDFFHLTKYSLNYAVLKHPMWVDLGTEDKYRDSLPEYDWSKPDQFTYFLKDKVVKFFSQPTHAESFANKPANQFPLKSRFPKVTAVGNFASYPFIEGESAYTAMTSDMFLGFLEIMNNEFWNKLPAPAEGEVEERMNMLMRQWPCQKAHRRLEAYDRSHPYDYLEVNGIELDHKWERVLDDIHAAKLDVKYGIIHGDLTLDNLIVTPAGVVKMLDWRPTAYTNFKHSAGDVYYDLGKLWLSLLIDLSQVKTGNMHVVESVSKLEIGMPCNSRLEHLQDVFMAWCASHGYDMHTIEAQTVMQLASMSGVHHDPFSSAFYWYGLYLAHKTA